MLDAVVDELHKRLQQAKDVAPASLLENRWLHLGLALAVGYAIGRTRARVQMGPFARTLATAAMSTLVRTALQSHDRNAAPN